jgi:CrcB protein
MNPLLFVALSVAGGLGAALRLLVDGLIRNRFTVAYPLGTTVINVSGALVLGLITGATLGHFFAPEWQLILGTGLMGGYTTFSTASFETVRLIQDRRYPLGLSNGLGMLVVSVAAAGCGLWLGGRL